MKLRTLTLCAIGYVVVAVAAGCGREHSSQTAGGGNSETHFLDECTEHCPGGLECVCGVCTKPCDSASDCAKLSPGASCVATCGDASSSMCDVTCRTTLDCAELGPESACRAGHCRFDGAEATAGAPGAGGTGATNVGGRAGRGGSGGASSQGGAGGDAGGDEAAGQGNVTSGSSGASGSNGGTAA
ncbi:MAG TPA: hypothetical protein VNN72_19325, partial [Polyangiaceae bacterium]|nr:hypothetical protein [Polyangiaceae bacterium]